MSLAPGTNHICYYVHSKSFKSWVPLKIFSVNFCQLALWEFHPKISSLWRVSKYPVLQGCNITKQSYKSSLLWNKVARYLYSGLGTWTTQGFQQSLLIKDQAVGTKGVWSGVQVCFFFFSSHLQFSLLCLDLQLSLNLLDLFLLGFFPLSLYALHAITVFMLILCITYYVSECIEIHNRKARQKC